MTIESPAPSENAQQHERSAPPKKAKMRWVTPVLGVVAALAIGLFGGMFIGQHTANAQSAANGANGQGLRSSGGFENRQNLPNGQGGFTAGTIDSIDGDSIVMTLTDGTKVTIAAGTSTTVTTTVDGTVSDLKVGERITVIGQKTGSTVAATSIAEGDQFGGAGRVPTPAPTSSGQ